MFTVKLSAISIRSTLRGAALCLVLVSPAWHRSNADEAKDSEVCVGSLFHLPIEMKVFAQSSLPVVNLDMEGLGRMAVLVDTGVPANLAYVYDEKNGEKLPELRISHSWKIAQLNRALTFSLRAIPENVYQILRKAEGSPFVINPRLIAEQDFVVLDFKRKRLIGFRNEADLRHCYPISHSEQIYTNDSLASRIAADVSIDNVEGGRVVLDTGASTSRFLAPKFPTPGATKLEDLTFTGEDGRRRVPYGFAGRQVTIAGHSLQINKFTQQSDGAAFEREGYVAVIGMEDLAGAVLIFPPRSCNCWEIGF